MVTLATVDPVTVPRSELPIRATMAGPAVNLQPTQRPKLMINRVPPKADRSPPKKNEQK